MRISLSRFPLLFLALVALAAACSTVPPNLHTIVTRDCWNHYTLVKPGDPKPRLNYTCEKQIVLPAYQMPGQVEIAGRFKGDAKATLIVDYLYEITDPLLFVSQAKFLLQSGLDDADDYNTENKALELAENTITDKLVKDIVRDSLAKISIMDFDESAFENVLQTVSDKLSRTRGVTISAISLKIDYGPQTEQAKDAISAKGMYEAANAAELGEKIIAAQASKPEITITVEAPRPAEESK